VPTKIISSATTLTVQPPRPLPAGFANGSATGTFDAASGSWTPGRTAGVVNAASWAIVPAGRWVQVSDTRIDGLTAAVSASAPGWDGNSLRWDAVLNAWNGFAIDVAGSRMWLVAAGGHADSSNNGIYRFDAYNMAWAIERPPSDRRAWSAQYINLAAPQQGSYTACYESQVQSGLAAQPDVNGWAYDELFWDRRPTSRHVYSSVIYSPNSNELVMGCRRLWRYSLSTGDWTYKRTYPGPIDGAELYAFHDEVRDEYLIGGMGDGIYKSYGYKLGSNTWSSWGSPWSLYGVADCRHGRVVTAFATINSERTGTYPGKYWRYDLDSRSLTASGNVQLAGGLAFSDFYGDYGYDGGSAMAYIPGINRYWILQNMRGGMRWLELDPSSTPWTLRPLSFPSGTPTTRDKPCRKLVYLPDLSALVLFSGSDIPGYVYKF
jgi:hypothetical protein